MTLREIEAMPQEFLTPKQVATAIGTDPNLIRYQAHNAPHKLGFPVVVVGSRVKIPKEGFLNFCRGKER